MSVPGYRVSLHQTFPSRFHLTLLPASASTPPQWGTTHGGLGAKRYQANHIHMEKKTGFSVTPKTGLKPWLWLAKKNREVGNDLQVCYFLVGFWSFSFKKNLTFAMNISLKKLFTIIASAPEGVMWKQPENSPQKGHRLETPADQTKNGGHLASSKPQTATWLQHPTDRPKNPVRQHSIWTEWL